MTELRIDECGEPIAKSCGRKRATIRERKRAQGFCERDYMTLMERVAELERRIAELEARQPTIIHQHYHPPAYIPAPTFTPHWTPHRYEVTTS